MSFLARLRAPVYKNAGSVARDHLASERTFLAWLRTGLGFVALGIAVERFSQLDVPELLLALRQQQQQQPQQGGQRDSGDKRAGRGFKESSDVLVGALLGTGTGSIVYGTARYFENMRLLERRRFKPAFWGAGLLGVAVAGLAGGVYWSSVRERIGERNGEREVEGEGK
ncbi:Ergosterol biosynthesis ERG4/ERG24 [Neofusicoccum parvum]|uniref:Ergosterol biosynthesis ERG4/ERG24 n=1 Tax=Neofusicoccum parvum TaxID=310453 RepID=A0ACB5RQA5_9PEZI|nr:Ergosterol biosynthesis ERG4/ERG24 [Neofusicoccum parvum]